MILSRLSIFKYRRYEPFNISFDGKVNIFLGRNGTGKTHLIRLINQLSVLNLSKLDLSEGCNLELEFRMKDRKSILKVSSDPLRLESTLDALENDVIGQRESFSENVTYFSIDFTTFSLQDEELSKLVLTNFDLSITDQEKSISDSYDSLMFSSLQEIGDLQRVVSRVVFSKKIKEETLRSSHNSFRPLSVFPRELRARRIDEAEGAYFYADFSTGMDELSRDKYVSSMGLHFKGVDFDLYSMTSSGKGLFNRILENASWTYFQDRKSDAFSKSSAEVLHDLNELFLTSLHKLNGVRRFLSLSRFSRLVFNTITSEVNEISSDEGLDDLRREVKVEYQVLFQGIDNNLYFFKDLTPGERRFFSLCFRNSLSLSLLTFIDELENGLHPEWINSIFNETSGQLFVSTHNPFVVDTALAHASENDLLQQNVLHLCQFRDGKFLVSELDLGLRDKFKKLVMARRNPSASLMTLGVW